MSLPMIHTEPGTLPYRYFHLWALLTVHSNVFTLLDTQMAKRSTKSFDPRLVYQNLCRSSHPYRHLNGTYPPRRDLILPLLDPHIQNSNCIQTWMISPAVATAIMAGNSYHLHADAMRVPQTSH